MSNSSIISPKRWSVPVDSKGALVASFALRCIRGYQRLTSGRPSPCRFHPSCSNYAAEAIEVHGAVRGTGLALRRLSRCRPLGPHGVDLVPEPKSARSIQR